MLKYFLPKSGSLDLGVAFVVHIYMFNLGITGICSVLDQKDLVHMPPFFKRYCSHKVIGLTSCSPVIIKGHEVLQG